jgi:hypothetical protein
VAERITVRGAAQLLRITRRQVFRLLKAYQAGGPAALVSSRRGKPSNRSYPAALLAPALSMLRQVDSTSDGVRLGKKRYPAALVRLTETLCS